MPKIIPAHASPKYQVTIPKEARKALGLRCSEDPIGFVIDQETHTVTLTKVDITPAIDDFTDEEYRKLLKLADEPGGKNCKSAEEALDFHKKLTRK